MGRNVVYFSTCVKPGKNLHDILILYEKNIIMYYFIEMYFCLIKQTANEFKKVSMKIKVFKSQTLLPIGVAIHG